MMLNFSSPELESSRNNVFSSTSTDWAVYSIDKNDALKVLETGQDLEEFKDEFDDSKLLFGIVRIQDSDTGLYKIVFVSFLGDGVPVSSKGKYHLYVSSLSSFFKGYHVHIQARSEADVEPAQILQKVKDASGAKYKIREMDAIQRDVPFNSRKSLPKEQDIKGYVSPTSSVLPTSVQADRQKIMLDNQIRAEEESQRKKEAERAREREQQEKERQQKERQEKERQVKEQQEKERQVKEQQEKERQEKNRWEKERLDHERLEREQQEKADKVRQERQRLERLERERVDKEQLEIEKLHISPQEIRKNTEINTATEGIRAVALYDYQKDEENEIDLREGENISNVTDLGEGWYSGTNSLGCTGLFPGNYVELINAENSGSNPAETVAEDSMICAVALYDYEAAEENEISFVAGDKITGITYPSEDWWHGFVNGIGGLFPGNYVERK